MAVAYSMASDNACSLNSGNCGYFCNQNITFQTFSFVVHGKCIQLQRAMSRYIMTCSASSVLEHLVKGP